MFVAFSHQVGSNIVTQQYKTNKGMGIHAFPPPQFLKFI